MVQNTKHCTEEHIDALFVWSVFTPYLFMTPELNHMKRGNVSGQVSTSLFNSFVNITTINMFHYETYGGKFINDRDISTLGDDNIFIVDDRNINLDKIDKFLNQFGMLLNRQKSDVYYDPKDDIKFLGFVWSMFEPGQMQRSVPKQTLGWAAGRIIFPETFYKKEDVGDRPLWLERTISIFGHIHNGWDYTQKLLSGNETFEKLINNPFSEIYYLGPDLSKSLWTCPIMMFRRPDAWRSL